MLDISLFDFVSEYYEVEKTVVIVAEIAGETQTIRLEAVKFFRGGQIRYDVRAWAEESVILQPEYPQTGGSFDKDPDGMRVWVAYSIPWIDRDTADEALAQAISFIGD